MPWGRLDDQANASPKLLALTDPAWRMWGAGLIYCQNALTDGFIPDHAIHAFGVRAPNKTKVAGELCAVLVPGKGPLWHKVEGGYQIHDYLDWNDSREQVKLAKHTAKQRMALFQNPGLRAEVRARDGDHCRYCGRIVRWNDRKGDLGGTYDHVQPYAGNAAANLVVCCRGCNAKKLGRTPEEAGMPLLDIPREKSKSTSREDLDISHSELAIELDTQQAQQQASTYHVPEEQEKQDPASGSYSSVDFSKSIRLHRRLRSKETDDGRPATKVISALARSVLAEHFAETDEGELREHLKQACVKANLLYDGGAISDALDRAQAQRRKSS